MKNLIDSVIRGVLFDKYIYFPLKSSVAWEVEK